MRAGIIKSLYELKSYDYCGQFPDGQRRKVRARSLLCFWVARELGMSLTALARKLEMSIAGVGFPWKGESS